jgi:predicted nucleic acid-binding protein
VSGAVPPRAVLDSDVIFSRVLYELLGRAAASARLLTLVWSDELLEEAQRVPVERKRLPAAVAERWVAYLRDAFPDGRIDLSQTDPRVELSKLTGDPGDRHVCALAVTGNASYLLTFDRGYLRDPLLAYGVEVTAPDAFLLASFEEQPQVLLSVLEEQAAVWGGGRPLPALLDALERARVPNFAASARRTLAE